MNRAERKGREVEAERVLVRWENCRSRVAERNEPTPMQLAMQRALEQQREVPVEDS